MPLLVILKFADQKVALLLTEADSAAFSMLLWHIVSILDSIDGPFADRSLLRARFQFTKPYQSERHEVADRHLQVELDVDVNQFDPAFFKSDVMISRPSGNFMMKENADKPKFS